MLLEVSGMESGVHCRENRGVKSSQLPPGEGRLRSLRELRNSKRPVNQEWRDRWKELQR